ncbi:unnamed protein product [Linum tenue]|uniref:Uncharacterized protein n=1 Tax=Linum tenue TaxID=586396 RepID=A0AAV0QX00_9ROSI|nr:unnamed protein product [Linum tenue]
MREELPVAVVELSEARY